MKTIKLTLVLIFVLLLNCRNKVDNSTIEDKSFVDTVEIPETTHKKNKEVVSINHTNNKQIIKDCKQDFEEFFERFARDSTYQKQRVKYPLRCLVSDYDYEIEKDTIGVELVYQKDYKYFNFSDDKNAMERESDKYIVEVEKLDTLVKYRHLGYDNGIRNTYTFKLIEGCWYMVEVLDEST